MKEQKAIVDAYRKIDLSKRKVALATVVKVRGSSYRSPGARMLITDDGTWVGSISGGCLEGDALRKARQVMNDGKSMTVTYDTSEGSNQNLGITLGCNGIIDVLLEPVRSDDPENPVLIFEKLLNIEFPIAIATIFNSSESSGKKFLVYENGEIEKSGSDEGLKSVVYDDLIKLFETKKSMAVECVVGNEKCEVFLEVIQPNISLIIFGGGFDARPVSQLAKSLGWNVQVTDECVAHIAPVFFPSADKLSLCQRQFIDQQFTINNYTACVLMSHNYEYDRDVLKKIIHTETPYIGILGPRKRFDKMLNEYAAQNFQISEDDFQRIHSPIGLDVGAETPDEIAISIVGEIQAKFSNRTGGFLKHRNAPIHHRDKLSDQVFKQNFMSETR